MERDFDAHRFFARIVAGEFDGNLQTALRNLSYEQLLEVASLMASHEGPKAPSRGSED